MNVLISFALLLAASVISSLDDDGKKTRKHYGLSYHSKCIDYVKSFTCMTTCKSIGFQIFRMDFRCKCSCHELKTTTILPFFKWRTNGTTKTLPSTQSPQLYHIAGTMSPARTHKQSTTTNATTITCGPPASENSTAAVPHDNGNTTKQDSTTANTTIEPDSTTATSNTTIEPDSTTATSNTTIEPDSTTAKTTIEPNPTTVEQDTTTEKLTSTTTTTAADLIDNSI